MRKKYEGQLKRPIRVMMRFARKELHDVDARAERAGLSRAGNTASPAKMLDIPVTSGYHRAGKGAPIRSRGLEIEFFGGGFIHRHDPIETPIVVKVGFRKDNLPRGTWTVLCHAFLWACICGQTICAAFATNSNRLKK